VKNGPYNNIQSLDLFVRTSLGRSNYHGMIVTLHKRASHGMTFDFNYTLSQALDQMQPEQQRAFDQKAEEFLAKRFPNTVVLHVTYGSNVQFDDRNLTRHWRSQTAETLKNFVFLILPGGEKVPLLGYAVAQGAGREFQFEFPREPKGHPLVGSQDKTIQLEFPHPSIRGQGGSRVLIAFKVEKMMIGEAIVF
jgi:hypothetical protein